MQWHGSVLSRLALVPQGVLNGYTRGLEGEEWREGGFVKNANGCEGEGRGCEAEVAALYEEWVGVVGVKEG